MLLIASRALSRRRAASGGSWLSAVILFAYAAAFSFAYISLAAGTGALILFGAVQATMILSALHAIETRNSEVVCLDGVVTVSYTSVPDRYIRTEMVDDLLTTLTGLFGSYGGGTLPAALRYEAPAVYAQLQAFYRQDPAARRHA